MGGQIEEILGDSLLALLLLPITLVAIICILVNILWLEEANNGFKIR